MTPAEIALLLTKIARLDKRTIGLADVQAWHEVLGDLGLQRCLDAVDTHHRAETAMVQPAHIRKLVNATADTSTHCSTCFCEHDPDPCDVLVPAPPELASRLKALLAANRDREKELEAAYHRAEANERTRQLAALEALDWTPQP